MHFRIRDKKIFHSLIAFILCVVIMLSVVPFSPKVLAAPATAKDQEWITAVNNVIQAMPAETNTWKTYLTSKFYEAAPFASDGSGTLNWSSVSLSVAQIWDGNQADVLLPTVSGGQISFDGSTYTYNSEGYASELAAQQAAAIANPNMHSPLDASTKTYYVYSPQQLLDAFRTLDNTSGKTYYTVEIMQDLDMNGMNCRWPTDVTLEDYTTIHGNGKTIYNLGMLSTADNMAMISQCTALQATELTFRNANICNQKTGTARTAVFIAYPFPASNTAMANYWNLDSISFKDCTVVSRYGETGTLFGRFQCNLGNNTGATIQNCNVQDSLVTGVDHIGSLTGPILRFGTADKCFSVGCTIISFGKHSGGLFSCMGGMDRCSRCFVDAEVFGSSQTGVFTGNTDKDTRFFDCYSSGFIEGRDSLGGFNGSINTSASTTYFNCYSTALVGLRSAGEGLGGFFGRASNGAQAFVNCYAAGEVGSADTISTGASPNLNNTSVNNYVGGFAGQVRLPKDGSKPADNSVATVLAYCYYDKQTTAMREWDMGNYTLTIPTTRTSTSINALNQDVLGISSGCQGLRGVLTTDTEKAGTGLTGTPGSGDGFTGFADLSSVYNKMDYQPGWDYTAANHYPELSCMANASEDDWGVFFKLVRDYSKTSTSTVLLETWKKGLNKETGILEDTDATNPMPATTYDTVRDLTAYFFCTGKDSKYKWNRIATATGEAGSDMNANGATVTIAGKSGIPVAELSIKTKTLNGESDQFYYADKFAPGLEWLSVSYGQAERRLRFMPTVGIEAGDNQTIFRPSEHASNALKLAAFYDHANDVELYYSTAPRLDADINDITTGIYPDASGTNVPAADYMSKGADLLTDRQILLMSSSADNDISSYFEGNHTDDSYGLHTEGDVSTHVGVDASFMSRIKDNTMDELAVQENSANGSTLFVYVREIIGLGTGGALNTSDDLIDFSETITADTYNGLLLGALGDQLLLFQYVWQLNDGRIITDAKLISVKATPFEATITAYDAGGTDSGVADSLKKDKDTPENASDTTTGLLDTNDLLVDVQKAVTDGTAGSKTDAQIAAIMSGFTPAKRTGDYLYPYKSKTNPDGTIITIPDEDVGPEYADNLLASWKVTNPDKVVTKVIVRMDSGTKDPDGNKVYFTAEVNPALSQTIVVPYKYYRYITSDEGIFFVQEESLDRVYTINQTASGVYYLSFNKNIVGDSSVVTDRNIPVDVIDVVNNIEVDVEVSAILEAKKMVTGDFGDPEQLFDFKLTINDNTAAEIHYNYYITHRDSSITSTDSSNNKLTVTNGDSIIKMKHGDILTVIGLPYGTTYSIEESNYSDIGYSTTADSVVGQAISDSLTVEESSAESGVFTANRLHLFVNDRSMVPPVGVNLPKSDAFIILILLAVSGISLMLFVKYSKRKKNRAM